MIFLRQADSLGEVSWTGWRTGKMLKGQEIGGFRRVVLVQKAAIRTYNASPCTARDLDATEKELIKVNSPTQGSQYLLRMAVNSRPDLLTDALRDSGAINSREDVVWHSPLPPKYLEHRDAAAVRALSLEERIRSPLVAFWPSRGPVWDALGTAGVDRPILVEAKAHIPEAVSRIKASSDASKRLIQKSLTLAQRHYAKKNKEDWSAPFYQYANRLAYHYWLREQNKIQSSLVFLYFTNAKDMNGPKTQQEWLGAIRLIHAVLGLPETMNDFDIHHAFLDARQATIGEKQQGAN